MRRQPCSAGSTRLGRRAPTPRNCRTDQRCSACPPEPPVVPLRLAGPEQPDRRRRIGLSFLRHMGDCRRRNGPQGLARIIRRLSQSWKRPLLEIPKRNGPGDPAGVSRRGSVRVGLAARLACTVTLTILLHVFWIAIRLRFSGRRPPRCPGGLGTKPGTRNPERRASSNHRASITRRLGGSREGLSIRSSER